VHPVDTHVSAEGEKAILLLHQTAIVAESGGLGPKHIDDAADAVELGAGTKSQM
jgi:hypothetical protein